MGCPHRGRIASSRRIGGPTDPRMAHQPGGATPACTSTGPRVGNGTAGPAGRTPTTPTCVPVGTRATCAGTLMSRPPRPRRPQCPRRPQRMGLGEHCGVSNTSAPTTIGVGRSRCRGTCPRPTSWSLRPLGAFQATPVPAGELLGARSASDRTSGTWTRGRLAGLPWPRLSV